MFMLDVASFTAGRWLEPGENARPIENAVTGEPMARAGGAAIHMDAVLHHAHGVGGPALRAMTFHDRARMLKALAQHLNGHKQALYDISYATGATLNDHKFDIDGSIGTLFVYASKGRREMPDERVHVDGAVEQLSRDGSFVGQHICVPKRGAAVHINAFNFPVWGMLEKLAPAFLAGMPAIVKPATATCYVTELCVRLILESGIIPNGALQLICGGTGDLLDRLGPQDVVAFTGSAATGTMLRATPNLVENAVPFMAEQDSLNCSILGPDIEPGSAEFDIFLTEAHGEMTTKAGQKCTAIRRMMVPQDRVEAVIEGLSQKLRDTVIGDPKDKATGMGALVSQSQRADVLATAKTINEEAELAFGTWDAPMERGAFTSPLLFHCGNPTDAEAVHAAEAFGPVATVMGYDDMEQAADLANRGKGSLVASIITSDTDVAQQAVEAMAPWHGRLYFNNATSAKAATGHGAPMPHMVHGGPGRAGGGEELGGIRGVLHYMQRTAVQGSPQILSAVTNRQVAGSGHHDENAPHPFTREFEALTVGETLKTPSRPVTLEDIEHFADFTGDTFYAHMDEEAAAANPFFPGRVAHGYLLLSFAAGLFVEPNPGPVLANTGLDNLRFLKPVPPGESIRVELTVKTKTIRNEAYGEVRWDVAVLDSHGDPVATYELLTMVARGS
ncbi:MAG: phenylacetic acid degradation bifunctional protein PaaZ [Pseudomonadota bacterium]